MQYVCWSCMWQVLHLICQQASFLYRAAVLAAVFVQRFNLVCDADMAVSMPICVKVETTGAGFLVHRKQNERTAR